MSQKEIEAENDRNWPNWRAEAPLDYLIIALGGEAGEMLNALKKHRRWKLGWSGAFLTEDEFLAKLKEELADVQIYLALIAGQNGWNLEDLVREKQKVNRERFGWRGVCG